MTIMIAKPRWIAADWGQRELRLWAIGPEGELLAEAALEPGAVGSGEFAGVLLSAVADWLGEAAVPVLVSGVGAREWADVEDRLVPCAPVLAESLRRVEVLDPRVAVYLVPGLRQKAPVDLLRGEETKLAGAMALWPKFDGVICLPGTRSSWVHVSAGEVVSFQSFVTGEILGLMLERAGMAGAAEASLEAADFDAALSEALSRPERVAARLSSLRAEMQLGELTEARARSRISGLLIGMELAGARPYWLGQEVLLIGSPGNCADYARGLEAQGLRPRILSGADCALAGLSVLVPQLLG